MAAAPLCPAAAGPQLCGPAAAGPQLRGPATTSLQFRCPVTVSPQPSPSPPASRGSQPSPPPAQGDQPSPSPPEGPSLRRHRLPPEGLSLRRPPEVPSSTWVQAPGRPSEASHLHTCPGSDLSPGSARSPWWGTATTSRGGGFSPQEILVNPVFPASLYRNSFFNVTRNTDTESSSSMEQCVMWRHVEGWCRA
ncbi:proline-rich protein HaeIII subfamily 1-like [Siniperca chuatsi]|uniref:proline-rich protein HaeIII subfamily 1-like n=1 Tax=Siniperca chuatsi TaxID=119488 RepID=UPI001CE1E7D2|nr:proline-rich protein HaeIII subfamily 1-like [Siniperca chuatsi]